MAASANPRLDNLLASVSLNLADEGQRAMERASGLTGTAAVALLALEEFLGDAHVGRLSEVLGLTHSGAVRLVSQLETEGLVVRRTGADKRRVEVRLTTAGRRTAAAARAARDELVRQATGGLDVREAATLEGLLARLVERRTEARIEARQAGGSGAWWCRSCDFAACGRPEGRCPAQVTAGRLTGP